MALPGGEALRFDVIVVGAGIMGSCPAYAASSRGARMLLLERLALLHHRGSSHGESRATRATYAQARYAPMLRLAARPPLGRRPGRRRLPRADAHAAARHGPARGRRAPRRHQERRRRRGRRVRLARAEVFRVPDGFTAAVSAQAGVIKATKAVAMFQALAVKKGVVRDKTEAVDVTKRGEGSIVVKTDTGEEFHSTKCIVTVGAWTIKLVKSVADMDLPVQPLHTVLCYWKAKPGRERELTPEAVFPTFASYGDPIIYGTRSIGSGC